MRSLRHRHSNDLFFQAFHEGIGRGGETAEACVVDANVAHLAGYGVIEIL